MPTRDAARIRHRIWLLSYLGALVGTAVWVLFGGPMAVLLVVTLAPLFIVVRARVSVGVSVAMLLTGACWTTLLVFLVSRYTAVPALVLVLIAALAVGAGCAVRLYRAGSTLTREDFADIAFAGTGGIIWCVVLAAAFIAPTGSPVSWAMYGDSANNILFARSVIEDGGISVGSGQNPVPLTSALIALFMLPGQGLIASTVHGEILALAQMWSMGIVAACFISGALVLSLVQRRGPLTYLGVAIGSVLPLTWFVLSGSLFLGFVNFQLTLALLVGCLLTLARSREGFLTCFVMLAMSLTLVLAVWAPLAAIPGVALLVFLVLHRREALGLRGWKLVIAIAAIGQAVWFFLVLSLPSYLSFGEALSDAQGAVFEFSRWLLLALAVMTLVLGLLYAKLAGGVGGIRILITVLGGGGLGLAALLWMRRNEDELWSYYQIKFLWLFLAVLLIVSVAFGMALASYLEPRGFRSAVVFVTVLAAAAGIGAVAKATLPDYGQDPQVLRDPLARILTGDFFVAGRGDRVFDRVVELADGDDASILWKSGDPDEGNIMFWIIQMASSGAEDYDLRILAYQRDLESIEDLCTVRRLMGPPVTVVTADPEVAREADDACAELGDTVVTG